VDALSNQIYATDIGGVPRGYAEGWCTTGWHFQYSLQKTPSNVVPCKPGLTRSTVEADYEGQAASRGLNDFYGSSPAGHPEYDTADAYYQYDQSGHREPYPDEYCDSGGGSNMRDPRLQDVAYRDTEGPGSSHGQPRRSDDRPREYSTSKDPKSKEHSKSKDNHKSESSRSKGKEKSSHGSSDRKDTKSSSKESKDKGSHGVSSHKETKYSGKESKDKGKSRAYEEDNQDPSKSIAPW
jgi:hypothetical protein